MNPKRTNHIWLTVCLLILCGLTQAYGQDTPPRSLDDRLKITLFAEDPLLNTPTGIDVDHTGRVWVIESNTHFPPEGYDKHPTDRLLILEDTDDDGKAEAKMFIDGFTHSMSVAVRPIWLDPISFSEDDKPDELKQRTQVYLATRREILLLEDTDGDNQCDKQTRLVHLETEGNYPHNGLAGFAFDGLGNMYFGFGENLGADYKIIGRDGTTYSGGGEGGNIYQIQPDGTKLKHWATGFWNPHANCVDAFGRLFSVDNDPDSLPPCRLLHIIEGGDYGYRFRNGRKGLHPFTAWNGEIPGTLPMVAGTGEAPSGILAYEHDAFPEEYLGNLIVTSWGDHRIDRFQLQRKGSSFESVAEPFIVGGENFRPVGIALAPDGSLYLSDWVLRDYKIHGKGRVWRIRAKGATERVMEKEKSLEQRLKSTYLLERRFAAGLLAKSTEGRAVLKDSFGKSLARVEIEALWSLAQVPLDIEVIGLQHAWTIQPTIPNRIESEIVLRELWRMLSKMEVAQIPYSYELGMFVDTMAYSYLLSLAEADPDIKELVSLNGIYGSLNPQFFLFEQGPVDLFEEDEADNIDDRFNKNAIKAVSQLDPFAYSAFVRAMSRGPDTAPIDTSGKFSRIDSPRLRLAYLLSTRLRDPEIQAPLIWAFHDSSPMIRRAAVQWVAEEKLIGFRPQVAEILNEPDLTPDLFLATLAALEMLDGKPPQEFDKTPPGKYVLPILKDETKPANVRAIALQLIDPDDEELPAELVAELMNIENEKLKTEAIRTASLSTKPEFTKPLADIALDVGQPDELRAEAVVGLARHVSVDPDLKNVLELIWKNDKPMIAREAIRTTRQPSKERPTEPFKLVEKPNANAGRRLFFHPQGPGCYKCHVVQGRGGNIGPNLTNIGGSMSREKLIESIRKPSQEVAPQFTTWTMISTKGKSYTGMIVHENTGDTVLGMQDGTTVELKTADVEERMPQKTSVMPEKLEEQMTEREFEDLLTFLESLK
jgi:putative membrane-bound dehydrogenase-like protein